MGHLCRFIYVNFFLLVYCPNLLKNTAGFLKSYDCSRNNNNIIIIIITTVIIMIILIFIMIILKFLREALAVVKFVQLKLLLSLIPMLFFCNCQTIIFLSKSILMHLLPYHLLSQCTTSCCYSNILVENEIVMPWRKMLTLT